MPRRTVIGYQGFTVTAYVRDSALARDFGARCVVYRAAVTMWLSCATDVACTSELTQDSDA